LTNNTSLTNLDLAGRFVENTGLEKWIPIINEALEKNFTLQTLRVSHNADYYVVLSCQQYRKTMELLDRNLQHASRIRRLNSIRIADEPSPDEKEPVTVVAVRLPDGSKIQRKFLASQSLRDLKAYVDLQLMQDKEFKPDMLDKYKIASAFPKKIIEDFTQTFAEADLVPSVLLHVEI